MNRCATRAPRVTRTGTYGPGRARSSSLMCVSAAENHTAGQYSKTGRTKPRKQLPRSDLSWNTRQDFLKIPSLSNLNSNSIVYLRRKFTQNIEIFLQFVHDQDSSVNLPSGSRQGRLLLFPFNINYTVI